MSEIKIGEIEDFIYESTEFLQRYFKFKPRKLLLVNNAGMDIEKKMPAGVAFNGASMVVDCIKIDPRCFKRFAEKYGMEFSDCKRFIIWIIAHELGHLNQRFIFYTDKDDFVKQYESDIEFTNEMETFKFLSQCSRDIESHFNTTLQINRLEGFASYLRTTNHVITRYIPLESWTQRLIDLCSSLSTFNIYKMAKYPTLIFTVEDGGCNKWEIDLDDNGKHREYLSWISDVLFMNQTLWDVDIIVDIEHYIINLAFKSKNKKRPDGIAFSCSLKYNDYHNESIYGVTAVHQSKLSGWERFPTIEFVKNI